MKTKTNEMKMVFSIFNIFCAISLFLFGCNADPGTSTDDNNNYSNIIVNDLPAGSVNLSIKGTMPSSMSLPKLSTRSSDSNTVSIDIKDKDGSVLGTLKLTDARIVLKEIKLKLADDELDGVEIDKDGDGEIGDHEKEDEDTVAKKKEDSDKIKFNGPYIVNLLDNSVTPPLGSVNMVAGIYKQIELKLHKITGGEKHEDGQAPLISETDPLYGNSIYLKGTYTPASGTLSGISIPFTLSSDSDEEFKLSGDNSTAQGCNIEKDANNQVIIAFRIAKWLKFDTSDIEENNIDFSGLTLENLQITLDEHSTGVNKTIRDIIKENIKKSADYGKDLDNDGKLHKDEDDDPQEKDHDDD